MAPKIRHLDLSLLLLWLGAGLVMAMWTADKFVNPAHGGAIMENFYGLPALGPEVVVGLGAIKAAIVLLFATGSPRGLPYGAALSNPPFARSDLRDVLDGLKFAIAKAYPIRGTA